MMAVTFEFKRFLTATMLFLILSILGCGKVYAQQFSVEKFSTLSNDVSAFINVVRDLNGEACAVVKVAASSDFVFSSPLGIVKRKDYVGEIWLYLPKGSKKITIKHPRWGVLRDYQFPEPLESRMTYELVIVQPRQPLTVKHDTIVHTKTITDTIIVSKKRPKLPLKLHAMLTSAFHDNGPSAGVMLALMRRLGVFIHAQSDLRSIGTTTMTCDKSGNIAGSEVSPYYSGQTRHSNYVLTAGIIHCIGNRANLFCGAGYGRTATAWQLAESEGGGYALNDGLTHKGVAAEAGAIVTFGRLSVSASCVTVAGKQWQGVVGVGLNISKK